MSLATIRAPHLRCYQMSEERIDDSGNGNELCCQLDNKLS